MILDEARQSPLVKEKEAELLAALNGVAKTLLPTCQLMFRAVGDVPVSINIGGEASPKVLRSICRMLEVSAAILEDPEPLHPKERDHD